MRFLTNLINKYRNEVLAASIICVVILIWIFKWNLYICYVSLRTLWIQDLPFERLSFVYDFLIDHQNMYVEYAQTKRPNIDFNCQYLWHMIRQGQDFETVRITFHTLYLYKESGYDFAEVLADVAQGSPYLKRRFGILF